MEKQKRKEKIFETINKINKVSSRQEKKRNLNDQNQERKWRYYYQSYRNKKNYIIRNFMLKHQIIQMSQTPKKTQTTKT